MGGFTDLWRGGGTTRRESSRLRTRAFYYFSGAFVALTSVFPCGSYERPALGTEGNNDELNSLPQEEDVC